MRGRAFWALLSGGSVLLASALAHAQCTMDTDCKGDRVCEAGKCTSPPEPALPPADATAPAEATTPAPGTPAPASPQVGQGLDSTTPALPAPEGATTPLGADEPKVRRRSRGAMVAGIIMASVGPIALLGALAAKNGQDRCDESLDNDYPDHRLPTSEKYRVDDCNSYSTPLYIFGIGGAALIAAGVPLIIYGAKTLPPEQKAASLRVLPWAGPESAGLRLRLEM
jgi:hypothetical protein